MRRFLAVIGSLILASVLALPVVAQDAKPVSKERKIRLVLLLCSMVMGLVLAAPVMGAVSSDEVLGAVEKVTPIIEQTA